MNLPDWLKALFGPPMTPRESLSSRAPMLCNVLGGCLPPGEWDYPTEEAALEAFVEPDAGFEQALVEAKALLNSEDFPWQELQGAASHWFKNEAEARKWLEWFIERVEMELKKF